MRFRITVLFLFSALALPNARAVAHDPLFEDDAAISVEITAPISRLINERPKDREFEGSFSFRGPDGQPVVLDLKVRARGKYRHANCDFPPLYLNFKRSQLAGTLFDQQNRLKMVVHCKDSGRYQESVLREYLAYRMLNAVTERSFRVRLLNVTYVDSEDRRPRMVRNAFLIELENRVADRLGLQRMNVFPESVGDLQTDHLNLTSIFQFLIGNTDFSPILGSNDKCCHNYAMFGAEDGTLVAIPYDFDMSGFVHTPYARPETGLGIDDVRERLYQGFCLNNAYVEASVAEYMKVREILYGLVAERRELGESVRGRVAEYLDEFYETIGDSRRVDSEIVNRCIDKTGAG